MRTIMIGAYGDNSPDIANPKLIIGVLSTGMIDKDGRTVYEGDTIEDDSGDRYLVYWSAYHCGLFKKPVDDDNENHRTGITNLRFYQVVKSEVGGVE